MAFLPQRTQAAALHDRAWQGVADDLLRHPRRVALLAGHDEARRFRQELWADLVNPRLVFSFFTIVAAANVFGLQFVLRGYTEPAVALWLFALVVWTLLGYLSFSVLTFVNTESGADLVHGGWLIAIAGTESLVLLGAQLAPHFGPLAPLTCEIGQITPPPDRVTGAYRGDSHGPALI